MKYHLSQLNIARFKKPQSHAANAEFVNNLDRVNAIAESQPGFVWRLKGDGNDAMDLHAFDDPNIVSNMSVWESVEALSDFVYRNKAHGEIMRKRHLWFEKIEFFLVLWWIEAGHTPTLDEAKLRLDQLQKHGPTAHAFTFRQTFPFPNTD